MSVIENKETNLSSVLKQFVEAPPENTPQELIDHFATALKNNTDLVSPDLFYEVVEQSSIAISITDLKAHILYVNPSFTKVTGYQLEEIIGRNESVLSDKVTPAIVYKTLWGRLMQNKPWSGVLVNRKKDGTRYLAELTIVPVVNKEGVCVNYLGLHRDVTDVNRLQNEIQNHESLLRSVLDSVPVYICLLDKDKKVILSNDAYKGLGEELGGIDPAIRFMEIMGMDFSTTMTSKTGLEKCEVSFDSGKELTRWFTCTGSWFKEQDTSADNFFEARKEEYLLFVISEITEQKQREEQMRMSAMRALLAEENLVQASRETLSGAIYQLQGPLNMVAAATSMLERRSKKKENDSLLDVLKEALAAGEEAVETLRSCMPEQKVKELTTVNINQLIREVLSISTNRLLSTGIVVEWKPTPILPSIHGSDISLRQLFRNIIENAIDAMDESDISTRELRINTRQTANDVIEVSFEDTGPGIPEHLLIKVFEPFFSTRGHKGNRTGMGLAMAQQIVAEHGGTILAENIAEGGCRIIVRFRI